MAFAFSSSRPLFTPLFRAFSASFTGSRGTRLATTLSSGLKTRFDACKGRRGFLRPSRPLRALPVIAKAVAVILPQFVFRAFPWLALYVARNTNPDSAFARFFRGATKFVLVIGGVGTFDIVDANASSSVSNTPFLRAQVWLSSL